MVAVPNLIREREKQPPVSARKEGESNTSIPFRPSDRTVIA